MSNSYIKKLHVKGFRCFNELDVEFNKGFNFIVGKNGCGKTSLLRAIILSYSGNNMEDSRYEESFETWIDILQDDKLDRIGIVPNRQYSTIKNLYRTNPNISMIQPPSDGVNNTYVQYNISKINFCPMVLGAFRRIEYKAIEGMRRESNISDSRQEYIRNAPNNLNGGLLPNVKQWMINRYFQIDKDWAVIEKQNWEWLISNLSKLGPSNVDFEFISIERELEPKFRVNDKICYLEELSSGFQSVLSIVLSIFEWIERTNTDEEMIVKNAKGTVIIDEIDVHLHPEWQLTLKNSLQVIFPNIQFIVTTHSPHMIATASDGEIIILDDIDGGVINITTNSRNYSGWNTDQILEDVMGVKSLSNKEYEVLVSNGMNSIEEKDISKLKDIIQNLQKVAHPSDTIVSVFKIKLAELQLED
ncbi:AAA family ATPase [Clostridium paraputrificum]|mgnify:CR=1 FL=1|uniref:AAA family ATPase n=1 Tax=Clostridium TaxID=1485 RepID=UPI0018A0E001|nr:MULTISPECIES: AAA family ATPase [Clostridium]MDB2077142.1 AAA family ATPase [Clostridium paraputrificum]MDB2077368.1 AAA family ATPase [Clostridium paraputrificum]MDU3412399.1 AAA family ATPase [Clostridium sp.]